MATQGDSKAMLPKLSHNWADAKKFNAQRIRRRLKAENGDFNSKENSEESNLNSVFNQQNGLGSSNTRPALAVSVTMSEDEESHGQFLNERSLSDNETTNVSAWAMMEHYEWSRDGSSKRSDNSNRETETQSIQVTETAEDNTALNPTCHQEEFVSTAVIEWQENERGELIEPSVHDDSSSTQNVAVSRTHKSCSSSRQIIPFEEMSLSANDIAEEQEGALHTSEVDTSQTTAARVREAWDLHPIESAFTLQMSTVKDDASSRSESTMSMNDGRISALSIQSSLAAVDNEVSVKENENVGRHSTFYASKIEELETDLRNQRMSTAEVQSKLKERVVELEQALKVTAATPKGTVVQENPLKTLLDRNQTLVKEVRFADQTCVELSSRISSLELENKTLLERVNFLEKENATLRLGNQKTEHFGENNSMQDTNSIDFDRPGEDPPDLGAKSNSIPSAPLDGRSLEMKRVREENRLLEQQLVDMKLLLETKDQEFEEEIKTRLMPAETEKDKQLMASESSGGRIVVDVRNSDLLSLEEQLQRERALVSSLKKELNTLHTTKQHSALLPGDQFDVENLQMVTNALDEMHHRYTSLEDRLTATFDAYISRIENLGMKVELLKSSLLFEAEPQAQKIESTYDNGRIGVNSASSPSVKEGDVLELMEEARITKRSHIEFHDDDSSINFEDLSHFVIDDDTLGSIAKNRSIVTDDGPIRWKENLEAVLDECNRVKQRSTELREEMARQKSTIEALNTENGKLSLQSSRKVEELEMVEKALLEARQVIEELERKLLEANGNSDDTLQILREKDENIALLQKAMQRTESDCTMERTKRQILEKRVSELEFCLSDKEKMLEEATELSSAYMVESDRLTKELHKTQEEISQKVELAVSDLQLSLKQANKCIEDLNIKRQLTVDELSQAVELNTSQKKQIEELERQKNKTASEIEDNILESQCSLEAMRRERAELRSRLSKKEAELSSLKEMHTTYKETNQIQLDKRLKQVQSLQAERADALFHFENLQVMRQEFFVLLQSIDFGDNFVNNIAVNHRVVNQDRKLQWLEQEMSCWTDILQYIGGVLRAIPRRNKDLSEAMERIVVLSDALGTLEKSEKECKTALQEERDQNERLCSLLGQAEFEMERSALQIQEMSAALSHLQKKEADLNEKIRASKAETCTYSDKLIVLEQQTSKEREELHKNKIEMDDKLKKQSIQLVEMSVELSEAKNELETMMDHQQSQATMLASKEEKLAASESKCSRLRDYIQKLTKKCEEWEKSYDQQLQCIERLRRKNIKVLDKASEIARKYQKLKADLQRKKQSSNTQRKKWNHDRSNIKAIHMQLEEELDLIANELNA